jgi:hypothetical protein
VEDWPEATVARKPSHRIKKMIARCENARYVYILAKRDEGCYRCFVDPCKQIAGGTVPL